MTRLYIDPLRKWFETDLATVKTENQTQQFGDSWFSRLSAACSSTMIQLIYIHLVFGRKPFSKLSTVADLLKRLPTPPTTSNHFDHFPINTATLNEWVRHFESDAQSEAVKPTVPESIGSDDFAAILSYPAVPVLPHQPSAFAVALDSCNIYGQAAMMLRRI